MLPEIERKHDREAGELTNLMIAHKDRMESAACMRVCVHHGPAYATRSSHFFNVRHETLCGSVLLARRLRKRALGAEWGRGTLKLFEIVLVHAHTVELKCESTAQFSDNIRVKLKLAGAYGPQLLCNQIQVLYIALVQGEMHFNLLF